MLIHIDRYKPNTREWVAHGQMDVETAYKIYNTQHHLAEVIRQIEENGCYRTTSTYEKWEWDEQMDEDFLVVETVVLRFTVSIHNDWVAA